MSDDVNSLAKIAKYVGPPTSLCRLATYMVCIKNGLSSVEQAPMWLSRWGDFYIVSVSRCSQLTAIVGKDHITEQSRIISSMPAKYGGIGFLDPSSVSQLEYESSLQATSHLTALLSSRSRWPEEYMMRLKTKQWRRLTWHQKRVLHLGSHLSHSPLAKYGFFLNKQMFHDAICLRYKFALMFVTRTCVRLWGGLYNQPLSDMW